MKDGSFTAPSAPPFDGSIPIPVAVAIDDPFPANTTPSAPMPAVEPPLCAATSTITKKSVRLQTGLPSSSVRMTCPFCNQTMITRTRGEISGTTVTVVVCLTIFCCPFFWLPLVCNCVSNSLMFCECLNIGFNHKSRSKICSSSRLQKQCKDTVHFCSVCGSEVGLRSACC